jgi:signal transduction histidine kinase
MEHHESAKAEMHEELARVADLARRSGLLRPSEDDEILLGAQTEVLGALAGWEPGDADRGEVLPELLARVLIAEEREHDSEPAALEALVDGLPSVGVAPFALLRATLRSPELRLLDPGVVCGLAMRLLAALGPIRDVSLWAPAETPELRCIAWAGEFAPADDAARLAVRLTQGLASDAEGVLGLSVERAGEPFAVLLVRPEPGSGERARAFASETAAAMVWVLEREALMIRNAAGERALSQSGERRLARLGFDLHDGPLQELLLLGEDLDLFREQLATILEGRRGKEQLAGRLDDLDARLVALELALRRISTSVHASVVADRPFEEALGDLLESFLSRAGIQPRVSLQGDLATISASQRIAVLSVVGEALNNVREHSGAAEVSVAIVLDQDGLHARVSDDGNGFDIEEGLIRAARRGRMGLAGMHERVRLLGGHCRIESRPGGPTEISLALPPWLPSAAAGEQGTASARG